MLEELQSDGSPDNLRNAEKSTTHSVEHGRTFALAYGTKKGSSTTDTAASDGDKLQIFNAIHKDGLDSLNERPRKKFSFFAHNLD